MKTALCLILSLFASVAFAQTIDHKLCTVVTLDSATVVDGCTTYHGLSLSDLQKNRARLADAVVKPAQKIKGNGRYVMVLSEEVVTDGKTTKSDPVTLSGLTLRDVTRVARAIYKAAADVLDDADSNDDKRGKHWGK